MIRAPYVRRLCE